jgi:hypothetical protein
MIMADLRSQNWHPSTPRSHPARNSRQRRLLFGSLVCMRILMDDCCVTSGYYCSLHPGDFSSLPPQQELSSPQLHSPLSMSFPRRAALIIAHAHPTPLWTSIAWTGQFRAHAPHSMQAAGQLSWTVAVPGKKTAWGQTWRQRVQLMHRPGRNTRVVSVYELKMPDG